MEVIGDVRKDLSDLLHFIGLCLVASSYSLPSLFWYNWEMPQLGIWQSGETLQMNIMLILILCIIRMQLLFVLFL